MSKKELVVGTSLVERPIAMLVQTAGRYASELHLQMDNKNINLKSIMGVIYNKNINLKSIMGVISIGNLVGHDVVISADGPDEEEALEAIVEFLS